RAEQADVRTVKKRERFHRSALRGRSGAALSRGSAPARRPNPVTSVNGRDTDICIWWTHLTARPASWQPDQMNIKPATMRRIEKRAYSRAADLAKTHAEHWEYVAAKQLRQRPAMTIGMQKPTGHWRILEKEIR